MGKPSWLATGREVAGKVLEHDEDSGAAILARALFIRHHDPETMLGIYKLVEEMAEAVEELLGHPKSSVCALAVTARVRKTLAAYHAGPKKGGGG